MENILVFSLYLTSKTYISWLPIWARGGECRPYDNIDPVCLVPSCSVSWAGTYYSGRLSAPGFHRIFSATRPWFCTTSFRLPCRFRYVICTLTIEDYVHVYISSWSSLSVDHRIRDPECCLDCIRRVVILMATSERINDLPPHLTRILCEGIFSPHKRFWGFIISHAFPLKWFFFISSSYLI